MSRTKCVVTPLAMAFDTARRAFELQVQPGWEVASHDLREALDEARSLGDVSVLPCPLSWWVSAQAQARCWLESNDARRRGVTPAVMLTMKTLLAYASNTLAISDESVRGGVR